MVLHWRAKTFANGEHALDIAMVSWSNHLTELSLMVLLVRLLDGTRTVRMDNGMRRVDEAFPLRSCIVHERRMDCERRCHGRCRWGAAKDATSKSASVRPRVLQILNYSDRILPDRWCAWNSQHCKILLESFVMVVTIAVTLTPR